MSGSSRAARRIGWMAALVLAMLHSDGATAQEADTLALPQWTIDLAGKLGGSQAGYRNWTEGGINSLAANAQLTGNFERLSPEWRQTYESRFAIGIVRQDTLDVRKAEDVLRLKSQVSYRGDGGVKRFSPTVAAGLRTQFAPGLSYDKNPFDEGGTLPVKVSDTFSPATLTQSMGLAYTSDWGFGQRLGIGAKETVVLIERLRTLYGLERSEAVRFQLGVESHTEVDREVFQNVRLKSSLGLFAAFNQEELPDMLWENTVVMQVNRWLSADLEVVALFDRDISDDLQLKEVFSIALSVVFI